MEEIVRVENMHKPGGTWSQSEPGLGSVLGSVLGEELKSGL